MLITALLVLVVLALIFAVLSLAGKAPVAVSVLLLAIVELLQIAGR